MPLRLRFGCARDAPAIADLAAQAMLEDELCSYLCPWRHRYYLDFRQGFLQRLQARLVTPGFVMVVAVEVESESESESNSQIRGYSVWERIGTGSVAAQWQQRNAGWWTALERTLLGLESRYRAIVSRDRSVDPHRLANYNQASSVDCFPFEAHPEMWYLSTLAVDPTHQRRGIGRQLVQWGLEQARREQVVVGLEPSAKGIALYESLGFRTIHTAELMPGLVIQAMLWDSSISSPGPSASALSSGVPPAPLSRG